MSSFPQSALDLRNENDHHFIMDSQPDIKLYSQQDIKRKRPSEIVRAAPTRQPKISSRALLGEHAELIIEHGGREYRLRLTQNGKLILTA